MRLHLAIATLLTVALGGVAGADDEFDPEGWTLVGDSKAKVAVRIKAKSSATLDELAIVVKGVDMDLGGVVLITADGRDKIEETHRFEDGSRVWYVALGSVVTLKQLYVSFRDVPKKTRGTVAVYGRASTVQLTAAGTGKHWRNTGWEVFGRMNLDDNETLTHMRVRSETPVTQLTVTASGCDVTIGGFDVTFADGTHWTTPDDVLLDANSRDHTYYLPDEPHAVIAVEFDHVLAAGERCLASIYGRDATATTEDDGPTWDDDGWTLIGEDDVDLVEDEILIDRDDSTWNMVAVVAVGDDVTLESLDVHLAGKADKIQRADLGTRLTDGSRTRVLEISGKRRAIEKVRLKYKKHQLDANTRVQVYAR